MGRRPRRQVVLLVVYLIVILVAELLLVLANQTSDVSYALLGLLFDVGLVLSLPIAASFYAAKDPVFASFVGTLMLPPLIRVVTLATPTGLFTQAEWFVVVSLPLLLAAAAMMRAQGLSPRDVFLGIGERRYLPIGVTVAASGLAFGFLEFRFLRPAAWIATPGPSELAFAAIAIFLATGLAEELIFRGILLSVGVRALGKGMGIVYVTAVFTILNAGFLSLPDLGLIFVFGLVLGLAVLFTRSLWGAIGAHTLANVILYLILPFGF